jgi:hypothetical protein
MKESIQNSCHAVTKTSSIPEVKPELRDHAAPLMAELHAALAAARRRLAEQQAARERARFNGD